MSAATIPERQSGAELVAQQPPRSRKRRLRSWYRDAAWLGTVELARAAARRRIPRVAFDYIDGGAETERTMRANREAFETVGFRPRMGSTVGLPDLSTTVLGTEVSFPLLLSPVGLTRMMHRDGDVAGARAADAAGTLSTLSSMSGHAMEDVAAAATRPQWFQLYFLGGRPGAEQLVERAAAAGFSTLAVTLDTQIPGKRERDVRNGFQGAAAVSSRNVVRFGPQFARHPRWLIDFARDGFRMEIVNARHVGGDGPLAVDEALAAMAAYPPTWDDFTWLCRQWRGPVVAKGVITGDDARRAVDCGASGIIVSNHGGRQLDGMAATLPAMVEVLDAVGDQVEVLVDGGVRRGSDIARAVALGARAVMIGRPWAYAVAAGGQEGVSRILQLFRVDLDRTLRLLGCPSVAALDRSYVQLPAGWGC